MHQMLPYLLLLLAVGTLAALGLHSQKSTLKLTSKTWDQLVADLQSLDFDSLKTVARDYLDPQKGQIALEPDTMWKLLGGDEGLKKMRANADLMIALAAFAQQWNFEESVVVAERMRRDGLKLREAVDQIQAGMSAVSFSDPSHVAVPFYLHEAASAYYLMRQRLLALYETSHAGLLPRLAEVL